MHAQKHIVFQPFLGWLAEMTSQAVSMVLDRVFDRSGLPDTADRDRERPHVLDLIVPERAGGRSDELLLFTISIWILDYIRYLYAYYYIYNSIG